MGTTKTEKTNSKRALGIFISSMLIFGTVGVLRRYIPLSSALLSFSRGMLGGLFLLVFIRIRKKGSPEKLPAQVMLRLIITGVMIGINWILLFEAYNHTTVAIATLCYYMEPTIVMLSAPFLFGERLTAKKAVCAVLSVIGMVLVSGVIQDDFGSGNMKGVLLGLGAALFYSAVVIMNKKTPGVDQVQRTTVLLLSAGIVMLPYLLLTGGYRMDGAGAGAIILLVVLGIVHTGIAYAMYFGSMEGLKMQTIAVFSYIDPVSALLFSALLLREPLSPFGMIGAVLIIGSAIVSELQPQAETT